MYQKSLLFSDGQDNDQRTLITSMAGAVLTLTRLAEDGIALPEIAEAATSLATQCAQAAMEMVPPRDPSEMVAILRRLLHKKARTYWALGLKQERQGSDNNALRHCRISILLDGASDALGMPLPISRPAQATIRHAGSSPILPPDPSGPECQQAPPPSITESAPTS